MQMKHIAVHMNQFVAKALFSSAHLHRDFFFLILVKSKAVQALAYNNSSSFILNCITSWKKKKKKTKIVKEKL